MSAIDLPHARRLAFGVVLGQAAVTVIVALAVWGSAGRLAGISALLGGGVGTAGSLAMAVLGFRAPAQAGGMALLTGLSVGEAVKFGVIVVLFVLVLTLDEGLGPLAMLADVRGHFSGVLDGARHRLPAGRDRGRDVGQEMRYGLCSGKTRSAKLRARPSTSSII